MSTDAEKIKAFALEIKDARAKAAQGEWNQTRSHGMGETWVNLYCDETLLFCMSSDSENKIDDFPDADFVCLASNKIDQLCNMVIEMTEGLEVIRTQAVQSVESAQYAGYKKEDVADMILTKLAEGLK